MPPARLQAAIQQCQTRRVQARSNRELQLTNIAPSTIVQQATDQPLDCDKRNIAACFLAHARRFPDDLAIVDDGVRVTYGQLLRQALALARTLRQGHAPGDVVAIHGQRSRDTPVAMIACLLANLTFVVIDAAYRQQRILDMLALSRARTMLHYQVDQSLADAIAAHGVPCQPIRCRQASTSAPLTVLAQQTAYLLFTSGSTGLPKGICTGHAPLIHFVGWYQAAFRPGRGTRFSMLAGLSHDPLLRDIFVPLSTGGQLHIPRQPDMLSPDRLFSWMERSAIGFAHMTPQLIDVLHARRDRAGTLSSLEYVFCGGDVLRAETARQVRAISPNACLVNFYGTSETPQAMAYQVIGADMQAPYPLGQPIADVDIDILDEGQASLPAGTQGEIAITTEFLSDGYLPGTAPTGARHPYLCRSADTGKPARRTYLTGDLGYKDEQGRVFFSGRRDDQVKIRGYRVDCAEVAATIERHRLADKAIVLPDTTRSGDAALTAFVVGDAEHVKRSLPVLVPAHMLPAAIIAVPAIPLLPNGKTDRAALLAVRRARLEQTQVLAMPPADPFYQALAESLDLAEFDPEQSFVDAGGDSLSFIRTGLVVEDHIGYLPVGWEAMSFATLSRLEPDKHSSADDRARLRTRQIEPAILLRALAIVLVVLMHARIGFYMVATSTLFVVAGMSFARFLLPELLNGGSLAPTGKFILKYGVPAGLWQAASGIMQNQFWLPDVLMLGTMWANPARHLTFWFLDVLTAAVLIIAILAWLVGRSEDRHPGNRRADSAVRFSLAVLGMGIIAFLLQTQLDRWNGAPGVASTGPFRWFWLVALGLAMQTTRSRTGRLLVALPAIALAVLAYGGLVTKGAFQEPFSGFLLVSIAMLAGIRQIRIPALAYRPVLVLAQHSLFIYLFSLWVPNSLVPKLVQAGMPDLASLRILLTLAIGISASWLWNRLLQSAGKQFSRFAPDKVREG